MIMNSNTLMLYSGVCLKLSVSEIKRMTAVSFTFGMYCIVVYQTELALLCGC